MIVEPKVKGFLCITAHPEGCAENVREQIAYVKSKGEIKDGCKSALIIGASTGYGLASRITAAFGRNRWRIFRAPWRLRAPAPSKRRLVQYCRIH